jgi:hypothetical protein
MQIARASLAEPTVVVEHVSSSGPNVTHVRGTLIVGSWENLREIGLHERYEAMLPASHRDALLYAIASSWIPIDVALVHYHTCDLLELDHAQITRIGELTARRIIDTFLGRALRIAREAGASAYWQLLRNNERIYDRMYQGGGVTVLQTGPKDVWLENTGQPLAGCRYWRNSYLAYMEALGNAFAKVAFVKLVRPRSQSTHAIAVAGSWV